jgi:TolA-binding protein
MDEEKDVLESETIETTEDKADPSDNLTPDHPRFREVIAQNHELKGTVEQLQGQVEELRNSIQTKQDAGEDTDEEELALRKIEKRMSTKFVARDELERDKESTTLSGLEGKFNGSNGYPKFVPVDVVAYAKSKGYGRNYEAAYKDMHHDAIIQAEIRSVSSRPTPPTSEKPTGGDKDTQPSVISADDIANMSDEEYEKNREKILTSIKPK